MPNSKKASWAGDTDRISALPDAMLQHVLSFLQAQEAVRSCVLARRWRYLWKSIPVLRLTGCRPVKESREFMDYLLVLGDRSPLDACLLNFSEFLEGDAHYVNLWIRYALLCQVRVLSVAFSRDGSKRFPIARLPVISQYLTNLELAKVQLNDEILDFSSCPSLEELKMTECTISVEEIFSRSFKRLSIRKCFAYNRGRRLRISVPSLTSLQLIGLIGLTPFLEDMPALVRATVRFSHACWDGCGAVGLESCDDTSCECCYSDIGCEFCFDASCECCYGYDDIKEGCVFLKGLSAATDLKLIAEPELIILTRDLRRCPTFSKLKILSLNAWCLTDDHNALICILQHTPVLENLSLQLCEIPYVEPVKATYNLLEQSFASENLKIVEVVCEEVDERVHNIMKSLSTYGIPLEKINIRQTKKSSGCFNFVCTGFSSP